MSTAISITTTKDSIANNYIVEKYGIYRITEDSFATPTIRIKTSESSEAFGHIHISAPFTASMKKRTERKTEWRFEIRFCEENFSYLPDPIVGKFEEITEL